MKRMTEDTEASGHSTLIGIVFDQGLLSIDVSRG